MLLRVSERTIKSTRESSGTSVIGAELPINLRTQIDFKIARIFKKAKIIF